MSMELQSSTKNIENLSPIDKVTGSIVLTKQMWDRLDEIAKDRDVSRSIVVRELLRYALARRSDQCDL